MNIAITWKEYRDLILLGCTAMFFLIVSFMLNIVRIGLLAVGVCILVYVITTIVMKVRRKTEKT